MKLNLSTMVQQLTSAVGSKDSGGREKALLILDFAISVSEQILIRAGVTKSISNPAWTWNLLAVRTDPPDLVPVGPLKDINALNLVNVPAALDAFDDYPPTVHVFVFCEDRVVEYGPNRTGFRRVMTYEETARFVIFWLAEKILQIIRKNNWDRIQQLPELYDMLAEFWAPAPTLNCYLLFMRILGDHRGPALVGAIYAKEIEEAAAQTGMKVLEIIGTAMIRLQGGEGHTYDLVRLMGIPDGFVF